MSQLCDGILQCPGGKDEIGCDTCKDDEFRCKDGSCIKNSYRCDSEPDCKDNEDEQDCDNIDAPRCQPDEFVCDIRTCMKKSKKCDRIFDCADKTDEDNCDICSLGEFRCLDGTCLNADKRCDGHIDCRDGSDELECDTTCRASEFRCDDGTCIHVNLYCNGHPECRDGSDEKCVVEKCSEGQFLCQDGQCIAESFRCDNFNDCLDGSDEINCTCGANEFLCQDQRTCVQEDKKCDRIRDCPDGSDETDCRYPERCAHNEFICPDQRTCVPQHKKCDKIPDCPDGWDESSCVGSCSSNEFLCPDRRTCVPTQKYCDRERDCPDGWDEQNCHYQGRCTSNEFLCRDRITCVHNSKRCDRVRDCPDGYDEQECHPEPCASTDFTCRDGSCIDSRRRCDRRTDCKDGSDEEGCGEQGNCLPNEFMCGEGLCIDIKHRCDGLYDCRDFSDEQNCLDCRHNEFRCHSGECIPQYLLCNNRYDCADGSDEQRCQPTTPAPVRCGPRQFLCRSDGRCLPQGTLCDGKVDCPDYSDESNCAWKPCGWNEFRCEGGPCIPMRWRCDGKQDCAENSDELDCSNREVVFQCRDEGPARARVKWSRADGLPLPPGSRDIQGRLEMPNIQLSHSGTYICEAVGYPENTPGSRVSVLLKVEPFEHPPTRPPLACGLNEATCSNGECVRKDKVCDGRIDCSDGSDEMRCNPHGCEPNEFRCDNKKCVLKNWRCDSEDDCGDGSDERGCVAIPGSPCKYNEHLCRTGGQCIPKSFHCDGETDCLDGSDEVATAIIVTPPPPMLMVPEGDTYIITCKAIGVPVPEIVWRLNWGHVPEKCTSTSVDGFGTLSCPNAEERDQGAYSCEAVMVRGGSVFAVPDTILVVKTVPSTCEVAHFNALPPPRRECIACFCFGVASECSSANLYIHQLPPPINVYNLIGVQVDPSGRATIVQNLPSLLGLPEIRPISTNGFTVYHSEPNERTILENNVIPYFSMPESYHGNLLKSYGGSLKYTVRSEGRGRYLDAPDVILSGNGYILVHPGARIVQERNNDVTVRFFYGEWYKNGYSRRGSDSGRIVGELASREEIMMTLANIDYLLIRAMYDDGNLLETTISNIKMDTADASNIGLGAATYVEECRCPAGYHGLSCERCAPGYHRVKTGPWLGNCIYEETCQPGYYGDPGRGIPCQICPCPLTSPSNQFGRTCILDSDGQPTCNCPQGYRGRRCEYCEDGYEGNPTIPGSSCVRIEEHCNPHGSLSRYPDPTTGQCICKENVYGALCDKCKADAFYLDRDNPFGCLLCFCMGITNQCQSSSWYRQKHVLSFASSTMDVKLVRKGQGPITQNITDGIRINPSTREVIFSDFPRGEPAGEFYYWSLPEQFLGDKVTSYGGHLTFTLRYVPAPGGQSSRNSAAVVEIISRNNLHLLWYRGEREPVVPDKQETINVPLNEHSWQRLDAKPVDRPNFLMALADIQYILIKATYTTSTREAALHHVSMDYSVSENTGLERALAVEHCACSRGYEGLSCEDCAPGYTRDDSGIYLGRCQLCQCNGHSEDCDRDTGVCRNCRDNTAGDRCHLCRPGYSGDATNRNIGCTASGTSCNCDPRGSLTAECVNNQCVCKPNVYGRHCDECRPGSFGLSQSLPSGCHECFCAGVSNNCYASSEHYRIQIPMQIGTPGYDFTLTDSTRRETVISEGFILDASRNEIGYAFPPVGITGRNSRLFWSLPSAFTGNKVLSYGGKLSITQRYTARSGSQEYSDTDVIISGNGITLYWKNPTNLTPNQPHTYVVPLVEHEWRHLDRNTPRPASRSDFMTVLINLEAILVRASYSTATEYSYLSDVAMDTADVRQFSSGSLAVDIEKCICPEGYMGTSCETCARGYYLDFNDRSVGVFGACKRCPCNGNEESCELVRERNDYVVRCRCKGGYDESKQCSVGARCKVGEFECLDGHCIAIKKRCNQQIDCRDHSDELSCDHFRVKRKKSIRLRLDTFNSEPLLGDVVEFTCTVEDSQEPLRLEFTVLNANEQVPFLHLRDTNAPEVYEKSHSLRMDYEAKLIICSAYNTYGVELGRVLSEIRVMAAAFGNNTILKA
ncbi:hypothetical protein J437_LFUL005332 [Ladona fulva]|uniref:Basement membrane-specific heparan sulfate proteoglycan core protein n=1 Tax=Ladona fulva TaxID=123851 RepID=A0A8K0NX08_LADFU|nr:hypothetical protein J437_LFUL005332 [Ladona fulva]